MLLVVVAGFFVQLQAQSFKENRRAGLKENEDLAPFYHGVASGDPTTEGAIIWTRYTDDNPSNQPVSLLYLVATDTALQNVVQEGVAIASPLNDYTVKVDLQDLQPNTYYYYVFADRFGRASLIGRTKTLALPTDTSYSHFRAATMSCSSIYSGFFNGYARVAERNDLDAVIHTGDYIYDFVDGNGNNRIPDPYPETPKNLEEWRARHHYYELDMDAIRMRQQHPLIVIWDNHDVDDYADDTVSYNGANKAFNEWIPIRQNPVPLVDTLEIYRKLNFGSLVELYMLDCYSYHDDFSGSNANNINDDVIDDADRTYMGREQRDWLFDNLDNSTANWRMFGTQKMMAPWCAGCVPDLGGPDVDIPGLNDFGNVFNTKAWDGFQGERRALFNKLRENGFKNNCTVSGDAHLAFFADLTEDPANPLAYNPVTGGDAVGVELLPSSLTRENLDEILAAEGGGKPDEQFRVAANAAAEASNQTNLHHVYSNFADHGYGIIDITPERLVGEFWVSEKITVESEEEMAAAYTSNSGTGIWSRIPNLAPSPGKDFQADPAPQSPPDLSEVSVASLAPIEATITVIPNPVDAGSFTVKLTKNLAVGSVRVLDIWGRNFPITTEKQGDHIVVNFNQEMAAGNYILEVTGKQQQWVRTIVVR